MAGLILLVLALSLAVARAQTAQAPAPADAGILLPHHLPPGFGQVEAELRAGVDPQAFKTTFARVKANGNTFGDTRYVIGQTNTALYTLPGNGLSQGQINLQPCALWTPHYHPRASEILFVTQGNLTMGFAEENSTPVQGVGDVANRTLVYNIPAGSSLIVPQGLIHYVYNDDPACGAAVIITNFDNRDPGIVSISQKLFQSFDDNIIAATTGLEPLAVLYARQTVSQAPIIGVDKNCLTRCPAAAAPANSATAGK